MLESTSAITRTKAFRFARRIRNFFAAPFAFRNDALQFFAGTTFSVSYIIFYAASGRTTFSPRVYWLELLAANRADFNGGFRRN